jgi:hypothetical protein
MKIIHKSWGLLRRLRHARAWRRATQAALPACALAELNLGAAQAAWLLRTVCSWHALPVQGTADVAGTTLPLALVMQRLAARGVQLQACRLAQAQDLQRGDVLMLADDAAQRLFGGPLVSGGGMALVIDAGSSHLRLSPALAPDPLSCRWADVRGSLAGWVLRSARVPAAVPHQAGWADMAAAGA